MTIRRRGTERQWARGGAYGLVAVAIGLAALQFRHQENGQKPYHPILAQRAKNLAAALAHCQAIGLAAAQNRQCLAVWKREKDHFFSHRPAHAAATTATATNTAASTPTNISDLPEATATGEKTVPPKSRAP